MKHLLIVTVPEKKPRQFVLKGKRIGLGRSAENDIQISEDPISSSHLEFQRQENGYGIVDLESTNGTRLNGNPVSAIQPLEDGDRILIGETVPAHFLVLAEGETWEASTEPGSETDQQNAAEFVSLSQKLETLEADIVEKEKEAASLDEKLAELKQSYQERVTEYGEARLALDRLEKQIEEMKKAGTTSPGEIDKLEEDLMVNTQKVKVMSTDLEAQQQQISQLEHQQAEPETPAVRKPVPLTNRNSAPPRTIPPATPSTAVRKPLPANSPGAKTMKLTKRPAPPSRKTVIRKKS